MDRGSRWRGEVLGSRDPPKRIECSKPEISVEGWWRLLPISVLLQKDGEGAWNSSLGTLAVINGSRFGKLAVIDGVALADLEALVVLLLLLAGLLVLEGPVLDLFMN